MLLRFVFMPLCQKICFRHIIEFVSSCSDEGIDN